MHDVRDRLPTIKDQGRRGTCVAFAATTGHEMLRADGVDLSEEFMHWAAKERDGLPDVAEGTTLAAAARALADLGQPPEVLWPYDDARDVRDPAYRPSDEAITEAAGRRLAGGHAISPTSAALRDALDQGLPVLLGLRIHATWFGQLSDGRIPVPAADAVALGGHAVLLAGYEDGGVAAGEDGYFIVRNSWGEDWGDGGYGYLPYAYVAAHGLQAWVLA